MPSDDQVIVRVKHLRAAGMCNREPRIFAARHQLSWSQFVSEGLPASALIATGDAMALRVVEIARKDSENA